MDVGEMFPVTGEEVLVNRIPGGVCLTVSAVQLSHTSSLWYGSCGLLGTGGESQGGTYSERFLFSEKTRRMNSPSWWGS